VKISPTGIKLIKSFEGLRLTSYVCPVGVITIGYGHTENVLAGAKITEKEADALLKQDLVKFEKAVLNYVTIDLNQNQFDALVSFCFNVGAQAFKSSTLVKRLNNGENPNIVAAEELPRWNKGDGKVLEGLSRRRSAEVELFCSEAPKIKVGLIDITSKFNTWLKKRLVPSVELGRDEKANIYKGRTIRNCLVIDRKDKHSYVELGFGLGKWWIYDDHWDGLVTKTTVHPYAIDGDLRYLRNFPYFHQKDNGPEGWRQCQTSSIAMCLKYLDTPGINDDTDYLKIVNKYGDTIYRNPHFKALAELGVSAKFTQTADSDDVKKQIDSGLPVVAGILHHGTVSDPSGGGHFVVITGYGRDYWLVQDPYGEQDLINGGWASTGAVDGRNVRYSFKNLNPRFFVGGGGSGWCWYDFKRLK
jgi:GH24 family phage-related lysozyme (muramidase)